MNRDLYLAMIFAAVVIGGQAAPANGGPGGSPHAGGKAVDHMSEKGTANTNGQWSADPDRGWMRAEERHELHKKAKPQPGKRQSEGIRRQGKAGLADY
jgi:hypothetical protein